MRTSERGPAYRIETDRLEMRCWRPKDAPELRKLLDESDSHLRPHIPFMKHEPRSLEQTTHWLREMRASFDQDRHYRYGIFLKGSSHTLIGEIMVLDRENIGQREMGYWLGKQFCGQGYMVEAAAALTKTTLEIDQSSRVEIHCDETNHSSAAVAQKLMYVHEGTLKERANRSDGTFGNLMIWTMFKEDFRKSAAHGTECRAWDCMDQEIRLS